MLPWLLIVIIWACAVCQAAGQGLLPAHELQFGASNTLTQLQQQYKNSRGKFSSQRITVVWKAQRHIRQYGSVVSRFGVYSDCESFFADRHNARAVYRPSASAYFQYYHAITLVGYNNEQQYWVARNSYGSSWGYIGLFKVAYGVCAILAADKGEAYGIMWTPSSLPGALQLPVSPDHVPTATGTRRDLVTTCPRLRGWLASPLTPSCWTTPGRLRTWMHLCRECSCCCATPSKAQSMSWGREQQ
ncbi:hypothetical protein OEZ86_010726 [Tetradesmus obliquus]|nr:hypothetical protein OEZ86_010726 [Tetradesmus obliquus]